MKQKILQIAENDKNSEKKELDFNVRYELSLSAKDRYRRFFSLMDFVRKIVKKHENNGRINRKVVTIIQRA